LEGAVWFFGADHISRKPLLDDPELAAFKDAYENRLERGKKKLYTTRDDGFEIEHDSSLAVKNIGTLVLPLPPGTLQGTPVEVYIRAKSGGLDFRIKNSKTGEIKEAFFESEFTKSKAEMDESQKKIDTIKTRG
jgi:hypothetical protein